MDAWTAIYCFVTEHQIQLTTVITSHTHRPQLILYCSKHHSVWILDSVVKIELLLENKYSIDF